MQQQNEDNNWNERWEQQLVEWEMERLRHLLEAQALEALIELAKSQIKPEPPA